MTVATIMMKMLAGSIVQTSSRDPQSPQIEDSPAPNHARHSCHSHLTGPPPAPWPSGQRLARRQTTSSGCGARHPEQATEHRTWAWGHHLLLGDSRSRYQDSQASGLWLLSHCQPKGLLGQTQPQMTFHCWPGAQRMCTAQCTTVSVWM